MSEPLVYLIQGSADSGRHEILADLVQFGLEAGTSPVFSCRNMNWRPPARSSPGSRSAFRLGDGSLQGERLAAAVASDVTHLFILSDGRADPMDQVEALSKWLPLTPFDLGRIITVVNCTLLSKNAPLMRWYDACIHFSDVVLLNRREEPGNKWVSEYVARLEKDSLPCHY